MTAWRHLLTHAPYRAAVDSHDAATDGWVEVIDDDGRTLAVLGSVPGGPAATHPGITSGSVDISATDDQRSGGRATVDGDDLTPRRPGDLLHPLSHHRLRIWHAHELADGTWWSVPLATMHVDRATPAASTSQAGTQTRLTLADAAAMIARAGMDMSVPVGGQPVADAALQVLAEAAPWASLDIATTEVRLPSDYEAGEPDADPWAVARDILAVAGMRLYVDRWGTVVGELDTTPATPAARLVEGPGCRVSSASTTIDLGDVYNTVTVTSGALTDPDGEELDPITATASDDDPTSPTRTSLRRLRHDTITADEITTQAQADEMARARLADMRRPVTVVEVETVPVPYLDPGDVVEVALPSVGVSGLLVVRDVALDVLPGGGMRLVLTSRKEW